MVMSKFYIEMQDLRFAEACVSTYNGYLVQWNKQVMVSRSNNQVLSLILTLVQYFGSTAIAEKIHGYFTVSIKTSESPQMIQNTSVCISIFKCKSMERKSLHLCPVS